MRWRHGRRSSNIENRQRLGGKGKTLAGGGVGFLVLALVVGLMGGDPTPLVREGIERTIQGQGQVQSSLSEEEIKEGTDFVSVVLASTEDIWVDIFRENGQQYRKPTLVLFTGVVNSACGRAGSSTGPFYCSRDEKIYIDLSFYKELKSKMGAPGDFAQAYVVAHEVGHHVQHLIGVLGEVHNLKRRVSKIEGNKMSVKVELQADCFSGIWARNVQDDYNMIEAGDIDEALNAASKIGDDHLQKQAQGYVVPDSFTHGSSAQRKRWFKRGFETGDFNSCNTFEAQSL
jgi:predicted metalloprotease